MACNDKYCSIVIHTVVQEAFLIQYLWYNDNTHTVSVFECTSSMWWLCWYEDKHGDAYTMKYNVQTVTSTTHLICRPIAWWNVLRWLMKTWCLVDDINVDDVTLITIVW